jgi:thiamine-phosphate pyrophosphorylase
VIAYAISDPSTLHFDDRLESDLLRFASRADWLLYRDKHNPNYQENARDLARRLDHFPALKFLLHDEWRLAKELGAMGVHFSGQGIRELPRAKEAGLFVVASVHSIEEAERRAREGVDAVTLSPIFATPGKGPSLGVETLREAVGRLDIPVIALGGIVSPERVAELENSGAFGFASIRYFS